MKKFTVELGYEAIDNLVVECLKESYCGLIDDIERLENADRELRSFEKEDLKNFRKYRKGLKRTLKYYMVHEDFLAFMEQFS